MCVLLDVAPVSELQPVESPTPVHTAAVPPRYDRLSYEQLDLVLRLRAEGKSQAFIAEAVGCTQSNISIVLKRLGSDSSELAKHHLRARSYRAARRVTAIVENGKDADALKAAKTVLAASGVIEGVSAINLGVQVIIGTPQQAALDASSITVMSGQSMTSASGGSVER